MQATRTAALSPVCWAGGKASNIRHYRALFPQEFDFIVEPFAGGAAVSFFLADLTGKRMVLNDSNWQLMALYETLRDGQAERLWHDWQHDLECHCPEYYRHVRAQSPYGQDRFTVARRFFYLNHTCFNALWRESSSGQMNTPIGDVRHTTLERLQRAGECLANAWLCCDDFAPILERHGHPGAFVIIDPPYRPTSKTANFTSYTKAGWREGDDVRLAEQVYAMTKRGVKVMLASSDVATVRELYAADCYHITPIKSRRSIAANGGSRGSVQEIVVTNWTA